MMVRQSYNNTSFNFHVPVDKCAWSAHHNNLSMKTKFFTDFLGVFKPLDPLAVLGIITLYNCS